MANFSVRIELHHAHSTDYSVLHKEMDDRGFERTITADSGETYHLPSAEYRIKHALLKATETEGAGMITTRFIHKLAKAAITATVSQSRKDRAISYLKGTCLTSRVVEATWHGLDEVD